MNQTETAQNLPSFTIRFRFFNPLIFLITAFLFFAATIGAAIKFSHGYITIGPRNVDTLTVTLLFALVGPSLSSMVFYLAMQTWLKRCDWIITARGVHIKGPRVDRDLLWSEIEGIDFKFENNRTTGRNRTRYLSLQLKDKTKIEISSVFYDPVHQVTAESLRELKALVFAQSQKSQNQKK